MHCVYEETKDGIRYNIKYRNFSMDLKSFTTHPKMELVPPECFITDLLFLETVFSAEKDTQ